MAYSMAILDFCGMVLFFSRTSRIPFLKLAFASSSVTSAGRVTIRLIDPDTRSRHRGRDRYL